jgi:hypothetical protein
MESGGAGCTLLLTVACEGKGSPTSPSGSASSNSTLEIQITGELGFGDLLVDTTSEKELTIRSVGNAPRTVTGLLVPAGGAFAASWTSGQIPANGAQNVRIVSIIRSAILRWQLTVQADHTTGQNTMRIVARGVLPLFTRSGVRLQIAVNPEYGPLCRSGALETSVLNVARDRCERVTSWPVSCEPVILIHPRQVLGQAGKIWKQVTPINAARVQPLLDGELGAVIDTIFLRKGRSGSFIGSGQIIKTLP